MKKFLPVEILNDEGIPIMITGATLWLQCLRQNCDNCFIRFWCYTHRGNGVPLDAMKMDANVVVENFERCLGFSNVITWKSSSVSKTSKGSLTSLKSLIEKPRMEWQDGLLNENYLVKWT